MPEAPPQVPAPSPSPFSFGSAPPTIGISLQSSASSFLGASSTAAAPPSNSPEVLLKIKCSMFGRPEHSMQIALDSPVAAIVARLRAELDAGDAPMTLFYCGKELSCAAQPLVDVAGPSPPPTAGEGATMRTLSMSCLRKSATPTTPPVSLPPQAAAAAAAAARAAAAAEKQSAAEASTSATDAAPAAEEPLRVRTVTGREVLVPLAAGMTAAGLKQELQRGGEGPVEQFRLLHAGKELVDQLPLQLQKVRPGVTIDLALKHVPFKRLPPSQGSSSLSLHLSAEKVAAEKVAAEKAAAAHAKASQEAAQSTSSDAPASAASVSAGAAASASAGAAASRPTVASAEGDGAARACSPLIGAVAQLEAMGAQLVAAGHIDAALRDRFTQLADALRGHDEEDAKRNANGKASADGEQPSAKRPRQGAE